MSQGGGTQTLKILNTVDVKNLSLNEKMDFIANLLVIQTKLLVTLINQDDPSFDITDLEIIDTDDITEAL